MGDHLRLRLGASLVVAGAAAAAAATVLAPLSGALLLTLAAALAAALLGWPGALFALPLLCFADGLPARLAVLVAGALPLAALYAWRRRAARGERIRTAAAAEERARLAREMHDSLSKTLDALALGAEVLPETLAEPDRATRLAATLRDGSREAARDARGLIEDLRTSPADAPLPELVAAISQEWSAGTGVGVILHSAGLDGADESDPARQAGIELCWILREALRNVAAHARAETVAVTLGRDGDGLTLEVRDDGAGFVVPDHLAHLQRQGHHGLVGMHERARICGGTLSVWSRPGGGTRITATVPSSSVPRAAGPSGRVRLIAAAAAAVVPLGILLYLATPQERTTPLAAREPQLVLDPGATHGPASPGPPPVTPGRSPTAAATTPSASRSASARPSAPGSSAPAVPPPPTVVGTAGCRVMYIKQSEWKPGFVASVTLTNTGSTPMRGWQLHFAYSAGQQLTSFWSAMASQTGPDVTVGPPNEKPVLDAGKSLTFGLQGTWQGSNPIPTSFSVDGSPCE